jgi:2-iminobutanoate/2-iminopropanoate deaminase
MIVGDSVEEQTRAALDNLAAVLARAGARLSDVVRCGVFLANIDDFQAMDRVYAEFFVDPLPARTTVGATLAGSLVEIDCVALLPGLAAI